MKIVNVMGVLESLLFAAGDDGVSLKQMVAVMDLPQQEIIDSIALMRTNYEGNQSRGLVLVELAGTYQLVTKKAHAPYLKKLAVSPGVNTLSQAALETLAIISYKQPITRVEMEDIRGVKTESPLQTLIAKGLIKEIGRAEGPGRPILYGTTREFLDYFGLKDIKELPTLGNTGDESQPVEDTDLFFNEEK